MRSSGVPSRLSGMRQAGCSLGDGRSSSGEKRTIENNSPRVAPASTESHCFSVFVLAQRRYVQCKAEL